MVDTISRADAIEAVCMANCGGCRPNECLVSDVCEAVSALTALPSADAVQGEWIEKGDELVCSVCGNSVSFSRTPKGWVLGKFCQSCGARMKGGVK